MADYDQIFYPPENRIDLFNSLASIVNGKTNNFYDERPSYIPIPYDMFDENYSEQFHASHDNLISVWKERIEEIILDHKYLGLTLGDQDILMRKTFTGCKCCFFL